MKRKLFMILIAVFVFISFTKVNALELTQSMFDAAKASSGTEVDGIKHVDSYGEDKYFLAAGDYLLGEDISADSVTFSSGESTLDSNGKTLSGDIIVSTSTFTVSGNGNIDKIIAYPDGIVTINGGNYKDLLVSGGRMIVNDATVNNTMSYGYAIVVECGELEVNGGTFYGERGGGAFEKDDDSVLTSIVITGGTFEGGLLGFGGAPNGDNISISGGIFKGGQVALAMEVPTEEKANTILTDILASGYIYSPDITFDVDDLGDSFMTSTVQKEVAVVADTNATTPEQTIISEPTNPTEDTNTNSNPQTGDSILFYIIIFGLSLIGIVGVGFNLKKYKFN